MMRVPVVLLALLTLVGCESALLKAPPPPLGARMTGEQLTAALADSSLVTSEEVVPPLVLFFGKDGDLHGIRSNNYRDSGTWRVEDDTVCGTWNNWYGTLSRCWEVYRAGDMLTLKRSDRGISFRAALHPGNVANLR